VYGIDMPTRSELIAHGRSDEEICEAIGADALVYQSVDSMKRSVSDLNPALARFESSCFDGHYITGDVSADYLDQLEAGRLLAGAGPDEERSISQMNLQFAVAAD
jgi:amidophosphoribosyltransferase